MLSSNPGLYLDFLHTGSEVTDWPGPELHSGGGRAGGRRLHLWRPHSTVGGPVPKDWILSVRCFLLVNIDIPIRRLHLLHLSFLHLASHSREYAYGDRL